MFGRDAIDEPHVKAGECPCHGRIELRTLHKNLPESRRTLCERPFPAEFGPTLADFSTLDSTNFPHIHARHLLTQPFVASLRATTYMLRWTGVNRRAGSASHAATARAVRSLPSRPDRVVACLQACRATDLHDQTCIRPCHAA